ncbi:MAG: cysteine desulfurase [Candidatus Nomurabacteria bacterium]|jgi:cysteine desulfurase/selenocysteine lyase|nr:cysteine desulfurase [Candidatus Nomurabacteria bacterium]
MNREDFPVLIGDHRLVYLDSANTTLKPQCVVAAVNDYYETYSANIGRATYDLSERATVAYGAARQKVADFIGADSSEVIFTHSATYAINQVAYGLAHTLRPGDVILLTNYEHNSNILVWQKIAANTGATVAYLGDDIQLSNVKIFSYTLASNVTGEVFNHHALIAKLRKQGTKIVVDAAQAVSKLPIDVRRLDCDFLVFSSHKLYGPSGVGVLYARAELQPTLEPLVYGSQTFAEISKHEFKLLNGVERFEPGTPNVEGVIGLGAAVDYLGSIGINKVHEHDQKSVDYILSQLKHAGLLPYLVAQPKQQIGVFSLAHPTIHPHDIAMLLNEQHIAVRAGKACSDILMQQLGLERGVVRISFGLYTFKSDVDTFIASYADIIKELGG